MSQPRRFALSAFVSLVAGTAWLVLHFALSWPTSDVRTRLYILLELSPAEIGLPYLVQLAALGLVAVWISLGRRWPEVAGGLLGALLAMAVLYSGLVSFAVWRHEEEITSLGRAARVVAALATMGGVIWFGRYASARRRAREKGPVAAT